MSPLFAEVTFTTEGAVAIGTLLTAISGAVVVIFKLLMKSKDEHMAFTVAQHARELAEKDKQYEARLTDEKSKAHSFKDIAAEAVTAAEKILAARLKPIAPVKPESSSPPTQEQKETAEIATMRARATAVTVLADTAEKVLAEPAPVTISATADGTILDISQSAASMFQYLRDELLGQNITILIPERYRTRHLEGMRWIREAGAPAWKVRTLAAFCRRRDGTEEAVSIALTWHRGEAGALIITATIRRANAEEAAPVEGETIRGDIADVKRDVAKVQETTDEIAEKVSEKVAEKMDERIQSPEGKQP